MALGANLGDRALNIRGALTDLDQAADIDVVRSSKLIETEPVGGPTGQCRYLNAVAQLETTLTARELLGRLQTIEARYGRVRSVPDAPRTLDLDLLLYRDQRIDEPDLIVPHPRMWRRRFVLEPLAELCGAQRVETLRAFFAGQRASNVP